MSRSVKSTQTMDAAIRKAQRSLQKAESVAEAEEPESETTGPVKKCGMVAKGEDFWSKVDAWFKAEIASRGKDFSSASWKDPTLDTMEKIANNLLRVIRKRLVWFLQ
ncbi:hypothetical protein CVT26_011919 [Gymnopilus dilepis]|uniref:Uncharacterized protein n=1 Tax=Gymnopilus dilepis TaxID=231916 RepID=A0A409WX71_9AGAR|nr:hypothetical protein CVT26_011919 [Gymnopilus dilepis]